MSITVQIDANIQVICSTPAEAVAVVRELRGNAVFAAPVVSQPLPLSEQRTNGSSQTHEFDSDVLNATHRFLKTIRENPGGVQKDAIMTVLGVSHPKAIGSKSVPINKLIGNLGFRQLSSVYKNPKTPTGRIWRPGKQLNAALQLVEQKLAAH